MTGSPSMQTQTPNFLAVRRGTVDAPKEKSVTDVSAYLKGVDTFAAKAELGELVEMTGSLVSDAWDKGAVDVHATSQRSQDQLNGIVDKLVKIIRQTVSNDKKKLAAAIKTDAKLKTPESKQRLDDLKRSLTTKYGTDSERKTIRDTVTYGIRAQVHEASTQKFMTKLEAFFQDLGPAATEYKA